MIEMPPNTVRAVWLSRTVNPKGKPQLKHYILAHNHYFQFRIYNRSNGVFMGNIVETFLPIEKSFDAKVQEKLGKGYNQLEITWDSRHEEWQSDFPIMQIAGRPSRLFEHRVAAAVLELGNYEKISLDLYETRRGLFRLNHFESTQHGNHAGFPLWQTLFSNETDARKVLSEVIEKKKEQGFIVSKCHVPLQQQSGQVGLYPLSPQVAAAFKDLPGNAWF